MRVLFMLVLGSMLMLSTVQAEPMEGKKIPLNSFEEDAVVSTLGSRKTRLAISDQHVTDGRKSLEVVFGVIDYPNVSFQAGKSFAVTDWRPYGAILFDAYNPDSKSLQVSVRIDDRSHHNWTTGVELPPKKQVRAALVLRLPNSGMRGYPMSTACKADLSGYFWQTAFDMGNIASFQFFLGNTARERTMFIDNIHLAEIPPLKNIVDHYGQFTPQFEPADALERPKRIERTHSVRRSRTQSASRWQR
jgi:hypothetical protein